MKLECLTTAAQTGINQFCADILGDAMAAESIASLPSEWAWMWFRLREAEDKPAWFPHGKWATLQHIEMLLVDEARAEVKAGTA